MPKINLQHPHSLSLPEARARVDQVAEKIREKYDTESHWEGDTLRFSRSGIKGAIAVDAHRVDVHADLGLMLTPLKPMIEQEIRRKLNEYFG